jgi:SAM-dependent methyltransferase
VSLELPDAKGCWKLTPVESQVIGFRADRLRRLKELEGWHFWFVGRRRLLARLIPLNLVHEPGLILDIGCGTGSLVLDPPLSGHSVVGLDRRPEGLGAARREAPLAPLIQADAGSLPLRAGTVRLALLLDVLEHVPDRPVMQEIYRVLRPGGRAIITTPAIPWLWSYRDEDAGHLRRYTRNQLQALAGSSSLRVVGTEYYQFLLLPLLLLTRIAGQKGPSWRDLEERRLPLASWLLGLVTRLEVWLSGYVRWPAGSSLVVVCEKPV